MSGNLKHWPTSLALKGDKDSYINYLEIQIDKVTNALKLTQGFNERIESLQSQLTSAEEKIVNLTRLVKLQQSYADKQENEITSLKSQLLGEVPVEILGRESECELKRMIEEASKELERKQRAFQRQVELSLEKSPKKQVNFAEDVLGRIDKLEENQDQAESLKRIKDCEKALIEIQKILKSGDLHDFEKRITDKVGRAIDQMGVIVQDYAKSQTELQKEMQNIAKRQKLDTLHTSPSSPRFWDVVPYDKENTTKLKRTKSSKSESRASSVSSKNKVKKTKKTSKNKLDKLYKTLKKKK